MLTKKKLLIMTLTVVLIFVVGFTGVVVMGVSRNDLQRMYDKLKQTFSQEEKEFYQSDSPSEEKGRELKQTASELGKLEAEFSPESPETILARNIFIAKSVLEDMKVNYNSDEPKQAKILEKLQDKINKLEKIGNDLKENKKSVEELKKEYDTVSKIKIIE